MQSVLRSRWVRHPGQVWLAVVAVIFAVEYGVMLVLPYVAGDRLTLLEEAMADAVILTVAVSPVLWWAWVRPLRRILERRSRLLDDLFALLEAERRRIAHDLHDGVGQSLTLLLSGLRSLPEASQSEDFLRRSRDLHQLAQRTLTEVKELALTLRPSLLDDLGLAPACQRVAHDVQSQTSLGIDLDLRSFEGRRLPEAVETAVFRIFQEAISNVVKHAQAKHVVVHLGERDSVITLTVTDDGRGIPPESLEHQRDVRACLGLVGMRERAALLGGELTIESSPGEGTTITAVLPIRGFQP